MVRENFNKGEQIPLKKKVKEEEEVKPSEPVLFRLRAVVEHRGSGVNGGHFITYREGPPNANG